MVGKILLGALASVLLLPVSAVFGVAVLAMLIAVLWMSRVHALLRRAELSSRRGGAPERRA